VTLRSPLFPKRQLKLQASRGLSAIAELLVNQNDVKCYHATNASW